MPGAGTAGGAEPGQRGRETPAPRPGRSGAPPGITHRPRPGRGGTAWRYGAISASRSPASTCWTPPIASRRTVPAVWAVMDASIFIASMVATV